ncbi:MAG: sugar transferase [Candidatus Scalindua sediminis]|nr:sugar transferase [Candidatus Scalindua sediminis]
MIRGEKYLISRTHLLLDVIITALVFIFAYHLKKYYLPEPIRGLAVEPNYYIILLMAIIIWYISFRLFRNYESFHQMGLYDVSLNIAKSATISMVILICILYLLKSAEGVSRIFFTTFYILDLFTLIISNCIIHYLVSRNYKILYHLKNILIIGSRERASDAIRSLTQSKFSGYNIIGCLEIDENFVEKEVYHGIKTIGTMDDFFKILQDNAIDEVIFAAPTNLIKDFEQQIVFAEKIGITVRIIPDWQAYKTIRNPKIARVSLEDFFGLHTLTLSTSPIYKRGIFRKNIFDIIFSAILLSFLFPIFILIAIAIKLTSKGPVLFKQVRSGLNGREFTFYKFRTMVTNAEGLRDTLERDNEMDSPVFKITNDPRVTLIGKFLRKTSLDELPQLFNILKGEMSFVGPRPPIPAEVKKYEIWQMRRLSMKPGLTCLWQVNGRNKINFNDWMTLDLKYIDNWSLWLDLKIFLKTFYVVLKGGGQ